jgi:branched-chain amino acid transport system substrate-binding protein
VRIGLLFDFPQADSGASFEQALRIGFDEVVSEGRLDRGVEICKELSHGLPGGTARNVEMSFRALDEAGVLAVVGPSISDNGIFVKDLADSAGIPCINYTGGEITRSESMFHYQVGSIEEEPAVIVQHLAAEGHKSVALVHDDSPVGRGYAEWFDEARARLGTEVVASAAVPPLAEDAGSQVGRLAAAGADALVYLGLGVVARTVSLAVSRIAWDIPVVANSALMFGYGQREWRSGWEGWTYVDTLSDDNSRRAHLRERARSLAAGPLGVAAYDLGRLLAEGVAASRHLTRRGLREGLERVKRLPASSGLEGTTMGFGRWDHAALKGSFLVLRRWCGGRSVQVEAPPAPSDG